MSQLTENLSEKDIQFLKTLKSQGVSAEDAFNRLNKVKSQIEPIKTEQPQQSTGLRGILDRAKSAYSQTQEEGKQKLFEGVRQGVQANEKGDLLGTLRGAYKGTAGVAKGTAGALWSGAIAAVEPAIETGVKIADKATDLFPMQKLLVERDINYAKDALSKAWDYIPPEKQKAIADFAADTLDIADFAMIAGGAKQLGKKTAEKTLGIIEKAPEYASKAKKAVTITKDIEKSAPIVKKLNPINPSTELKFTREMGKDYQTWLSERVKPDVAENTVIELAERWQGAKNRIDTAVGELKGMYQAPEITNMLTEMQEFYKPSGKVFTSTAKSNMKYVDDMIKKHDTTGLSGKDILDVKRKFERDVKTGYFKDNVAGKVRTSTEIDSELREYFINELEKAGFPEFRELSKEIKGSRMIANDLAKKVLKDTKNLDVFDYLMLTAGTLEPTALATLGFKKAMSSKLLKKIRARLRNPETIKLQDPNLLKVGEYKQPSLPQGKQNLPPIQIDQPINLGRESQSVIDKREILKAGAMGK